MAEQTRVLLIEEVLHKETTAIIILTEDHQAILLQQAEVITTITAQATIRQEVTLQVHHVHQIAVEEA
jgi:hypothetical protein